MAGYVVRRLIEGAIAIWSVLTLVFVASRLSGDPAVLMLPPGATDADLAILRKELELDQPILRQYLSFFAKASQGDFGLSYEHHRPAMEVVLERLPATLELTLVALVLSIVLGGAAGIAAAVWRRSYFGSFIMFLALLGQATPLFWLGTMLIVVFSVELNWLPTGGRGTLSHLLMPAGCLAVYATASIARLLRSSFVEILGEDYIRTARSKGLASRTVFLKHALRNALLPTLTMVGLLAADLFAGAVIIETIFSWPGTGRVLIQAILSKDFTVVQAGVTLIAMNVIAINLLVDLSYGIVDPRVRVDGR